MKMKLALTIVVCIGLYLCAVSADSPKNKEIDDLEFQRILAFVKNDAKYFFGFPQTVNDDPIYQDFLTDDNGHPKFLDFLTDPKSGSTQQWPIIREAENFGVNINVNEKFNNDKERYNQLRKIYQKYSSEENCKYFVKKMIDDLKKDELICHREEEIEKCEQIHKDYQLYAMFLKDVNDEYERFVKSSKENRSLMERAFISNDDFLKELMKADLDFKLKCILAFRPASKPSSSSQRNLNAYNVLKQQLNIFTEDLKGSIRDVGAEAKLKKIPTNQDFFKFFGFWFKPFVGERWMEHQIEEMKKKYQLGDNYKAARVMAMLEQFNEHKDYLPKEK